MDFPNTCAIRMSEALVAADSNLLSLFRDNLGMGNVCPHGYVRGAQDLAAVLERVWGGRDLGFDGGTASSLRGRQGVVCYMNIPSYSGQGHIDLWDNGSPVGEAYWDASPIWFWAL